MLGCGTKSVSGRCRDVLLTKDPTLPKFPSEGGLQLAGGLEKVEPGSEKILGVGLDFKKGICPAQSRPDVGLEKSQALCEAYAKSIKRGHK